MTSNVMRKTWLSPRAGQIQAEAKNGILTFKTSSRIVMSSLSVNALTDSAVTVRAPRSDTQNTASNSELQYLLGDTFHSPTSLLPKSVISVTESKRDSKENRCSQT